MGSARNRPTVMVVDDDLECLESICAVLEMEGYEVVRATDGRMALEEGMARFRRAEPPDLILLDLMMPDVDGWQFVAAQRKVEGFSSIPVVLASAESKLPQTAVDLRVAGYLRKPLDLEMLISTVARLCGAP